MIWNTQRRNQTSKWTCSAYFYNKPHCNYTTIFCYTNRILIISFTFRSRSPDQQKPCFIIEGTFHTQPSALGPVSKPRLLTKVFLQIAASLWLLEVNVIFNSLNKQHFFPPRQKMLSAIIFSRYFLNTFKTFFAGVFPEITGKWIMKKEVSEAWISIHTPNEWYHPMNDIKKRRKEKGHWTVLTVSTNTQNSLKYS